MHLIFSSSRDDSTNKVIAWLIHAEKDFIRINNEQFPSLDEGDHIHYQLSNAGLKYMLVDSDTRNPLHKENLFSVWFRREPFNQQLLAIEGLEDCVDKSNKSQVQHRLRMEYLKLDVAFKDALFHSIKSLGNPRSKDPNKLLVLNVARQVGLKIPATLITSQKEELIAFWENHNRKIITKAISENISLIHNGKVHNIYTEAIDETIINDTPDHFFPSLFQEKLTKAYEIRSFFLDDTFYSMAIFSQLDEQTATDFRIYNTERGNRNVPFQLPKAIEDKLRQLMDRLELNTGSIDIVKTAEGDYVFLEVNPIGQYDMVSVPCNYHLDKHIAHFLTK